jgi:hypothetical protein
MVDILSCYFVSYYLLIINELAIITRRIIRKLEYSFEIYFFDLNIISNHNHIDVLRQ